MATNGGLFAIDGSAIEGFSAAMNRAPAVLKSEVGKGVNGVLSYGVVAARAGIHSVSGKLAGAIKILSPAAVTGVTITGAYGVRKSDVIYAMQREYGGTIRAKNAPFLVFQIDGRTIRVKQVTQTGSHYMSRSVDRIRPLFAPAISRAIERTIAASGV